MTLVGLVAVSAIRGAPATAQGPSAADAPRVSSVDSAGAPSVPPDRWGFGLDLALTSSSGNENITVLTTGFKITHLITDDYELELTANYRYGMSAGEVVARNIKSDMKFDFQPEATFSPFLFASAERDPFRKLDLRAHGGAGAKYLLVSSDDTRVSFSLGALYSYEDRRLAEPTPDLAPFQREGRLSWRFKGRHELNDGIHLENTTYYQPVWNIGADYLFNSDTSVRMVVNKFLALSFGYTYERDSTPLPDVRPDDQLLRAGVSLQW